MSRLQLYTWKGKRKGGVGKGQRVGKEGIILKEKKESRGRKQEGWNREKVRIGGRWIIVDEML